MDHKLSPTFCILPWLHAHVWADGSVFPCCMAAVDRPVTNLNHHLDLLETMNHPRYIEMRKKMINGRSCVECTKCYEIEAAGGSSMRTDSGTMYADRISEVQDENGRFPTEISKFKMRYMDIRFSNLCNLACVTCSPLFSQRLHPIHKRMGEVTPEYEILELNAFDKLKPYLEFVTHVNFAGGEPLISEDHYRVLSYWDDLGKYDVNINYTSNMTMLSHNGFRVINFWKKFKNISILASLDDFGPEISKIRIGASWNKIADNIRQVKKLTPHVRLQISPTVSSLNIHRLFEMVWLFENEFAIPPQDWQINLLQYPEKLSIKHLSPEDKCKVKFAFEEFEEKLKSKGLSLPETFKPILGMCLTESPAWKEFETQRTNFLRKFENALS